MDQENGKSLGGQDDFMDKEFLKNTPQMMGHALDLKPMLPFPLILSKSAGQELSE